uniref:RING-type domain-containing protein n=1 Tax=Serinus canaria TaxID=9135 RepID=A0A8C9MHJ0_SERCA
LPIYALLSILNCAICQDICEDVASTQPCHHHFCLGCILRWTQRNPVCPLCRRTIVTVRFSDHGEDDYLETSITVPEELSVDNFTALKQSKILDTLFQNQKSQSP